MNMPKPRATSDSIAFIALGLACSLSLPSCLAAPAPLPEAALAQLSAIERIDDYPAYLMRQSGGYDLDAVFSGGLGDYGDAWRYAASWYGCELSRAGDGLPPGKACTGFAARSSSGDALLGHNEDWDKGAYLVLLLAPGAGYRSISVVDVRDAGGQADRRDFLVAPFFPLAGVNEAGLGVSTYSVPERAASSRGEVSRSEAPDILWPTAIRFLLDRAATVDEALAILATIDLVFDEGNPLQFLIADASGDSVVVGWGAGGLELSRKAGAWQAVTNFRLYGATDREREGCWRYLKASRELEAVGGALPDGLGMRILESCSVPRATQFSAVMNLSRKSLSIAFGRRYGRAFEYSCGDCPAPTATGR